MKLIYWKNVVIRNEVIFCDVTRWSMTTIFVWVLNISWFSSLFCNWSHKVINFTFVSLRGGSAEYHALLYMYKLTFIQDLYRAQVGHGVLPIFYYTEYHCVKKANEPTEQFSWCPNKDIPLSHCKATKQDIWNFLHIMKWEGMPRGYVPLLEQKVENSCIGMAKVKNTEVIWIRSNIATTIFILYGPSQLWHHQ